jgi:hypothetical protein
MKDIQRGIVGGNSSPATTTTTQQTGMKNDHLTMKSFVFYFSSK